MKIASISNNYGENFDGIGSYAKVIVESFPDDVECVVFSSDCKPDTKIAKRITMLNMTKTLFRVIKQFKEDKYDAIIIEYPFVEWNPLILIPIDILKKISHEKGCIFAISLHEYERANIFRRAVIRAMCRAVDIAFVSNLAMKRRISGLCKSAYIRPIPTNIQNEHAMELCIQRNNNNYVYFGLINRMKAFQEMMEAWDLFNCNKDKRLFIISSTYLDNIEMRHEGVKYLYGQDEYSIISIMRSCVGCIVPIKPEVDEKNASFKTACLTGCISIGKFNPEINKLPFIIKMSDYNVSSFLFALNAIDKMSQNEIEEKSKQAAEYGNMFLPENVAGIVYAKINDLLEETNANSN